MELRDRLDVFADLLLSCHALYLWEYDRELALIRSNCPDEAGVRWLFSLGDMRQMLMDYAASHDRPLIMANPLGMMWTALPEHTAGELRHIHLLGPFFDDGRSLQELERELRKLRLSAGLLQDFLKILRGLPVISLSRIFEYSIMLHRCVTRETITVSDLHYQESETPRPAPSKQGKADVHGTYEMEQEMLRMVREGDLNILSYMDRLAVTGSMGTLAVGDTTRQMKNAVLVNIILFSRAAIEGGLGPEIAMTLTDHYFQSVEAARSMTDLREVAVTMQKDFVTRVHNARSKMLSQPIRECCDYISLHLDENLRLKDMAARLRYSETYLSRKFRQETGSSFKEYIRRQRLDRAKALLRDASLSIQDISDRLQFCSPSYFAEQFKAEFGVSPTAWRESGGQLF